MSDPPKHSTGDPNFHEYPTPEEIAERMEKAKRVIADGWLIYWKPLVDMFVEEHGLTRLEALMYLNAKESANLTNALNRAMNAGQQGEGDSWKE